MAATFTRCQSLREDPQLLPFYLNGVTTTGKILGTGSYGSVIEIKYHKTICAAKKIHDFFLQTGNKGVEENKTKYKRECQLMAGLRHPNITQFLGLCFLEDSQLPLLVMERLEMSVSDLLDNYPSIPLSVKISILTDTSSGLVYLHGEAPPIVHRDLTARNILLTSSLMAKIADLGNSRMVTFEPGQLAQTLTKIPGTAVYMPPEAFSESPRYGPPLDVFSFGHLMLYTLTQVFPGDLLSSTYVDPSSPNQVRARSEVDRRQRYMTILEATFSKSCPVVPDLVKQCLHFTPRRRPTSQHLLDRLSAVKSEVEGSCGGNIVKKLDIASILYMKEMKASDKMIQELQRNNEILRQQAKTPRLEDECENLQIALEKLEEENREKKIEIEKLEQEKTDKQILSERLEEENREQQISFESQKQDNTDKQMSIERLEEEKRHQQDAFDELKSSRDDLKLQLQHEQQLWQKQLMEHQGEIARLKSKQNEVKQVTDDKLVQPNELKVTAEKMENDNRHPQNDVQKLEYECKTLHMSLMRLEVENRDKEVSIQRLEREQLELLERLEREKKDQQKAVEELESHHQYVKLQLQHEQKLQQKVLVHCQEEITQLRAKLDEDDEVKKVREKQIIAAENKDLTTTIERMEKERRHLHIETLKQENEFKNQQIALEISREENREKQNIVEKLECHHHDLQLQLQEQQVQQEELMKYQEEITQLKAKLKEKEEDKKKSGPATFPLQLDWKRGRDMPIAMRTNIQSVEIDGKVYVGDMGYKVIAYSTCSCQWHTLHPYSTKCFTMTTINNKLVLVGGLARNNSASNELGEWQSDSEQWTRPYPPMPKPRCLASATSYKHWIIVAGGGYDEYHLQTSVMILDVDSKEWYTILPPLPRLWDRMKSVTIGDTWYLMGGGNDKTYVTDVYRVSLKLLVSPTTYSSNIWKALPSLNCALACPLKIGRSLLAVGGKIMASSSPVSTIQRYDRDTKSWVKAGNLPHALWDCTCIMSSDKLHLIGGSYGDKEMFTSVH